MWTPIYYPRYAELPGTVDGVVVPNDDGSFDIYINSMFSEEKQREILKHEVDHIRENHFYCDMKSIRQIEAEAEGEVKRIPLFNSLESLKRYARGHGLLG